MNDFPNITPGLRPGKVRDMIEKTFPKPSQTFQQWWSKLGFSTLCDPCEQDAAYQAWEYQNAIIKRLDNECTRLAIANSNMVTKVVQLEDDRERLISHASILGTDLAMDISGERTDCDHSNDSWRSLPPELQADLELATIRLKAEEDEDTN